MVVAQFEIWTVEGHGFSRAERTTMEPGFSPGWRRLKPPSMACCFAGLKPGASTAPIKLSHYRLVLTLDRLARPPPDDRKYAEESRTE